MASKQSLQLGGRPQFRLFEYNKFVSNLRYLRNYIRVKTQAGAASALALMHDRGIHGGIHRVAATNNQQGGAPRWDGSLARELLKQDMDEGKHERMQPQVLHATTYRIREVYKGSIRQTHYARSRDSEVSGVRER
jgi:hypothetical protein